MLKINEDQCDNKFVIGNQKDCAQMEFASIKKYLQNLGPDYHFSQLKFFFKRNQYLIAIQLSFQKTENFGSQDPSTYKIYGKKFLGPLKEYNPTDLNTINEIEEYTLNLSLNEEINSFSGCFINNSFVRINIKTIFGKFFFIGDKTMKCNFHFNYYSNKSFFDGFVVGFDQNKIMYLIFLSDNDKQKEENLLKLQENKCKVELKDISEDLSINLKADPIYKTNIFGTISKKTIIVDDMEKFGLIKDTKENKAGLTEIKIYSNGKKITRIDNQYSYYDTNKNMIIQHQSEKYELSNMCYCLNIEKGDYINHAVVYLSSNRNLVCDILLCTFKGKKLNTNNKSSNYRELVEADGKKLKILGMCIGREKFIQFIQFYHEMKNAN